MKGLIRTERGQAAVEIALVLPILIFLLLAIMEGGRIVSGYLELQNAARDGARYASIRCSERDVADYQIDGWVASNLAPMVQSRLSTLNASDLVVEFCRKRTTDKKEVWVEIRLTYPLEIVTPIIKAITGSTLNLKIMMAMRNE